MNALLHQNLNDAVEDAIRAMIVDGALAAGERLNEVRLAESLGVSRTPLREALNRLIAEGAVEARPRLGYFVKPLTVEEFEQIYDIRPILDPAALRLAGLPTPEQARRLDTLNAKLERARGAAAAIAFDDAWHRELISPCANKVLLSLIDTMIRRTRRYELALMRETKNVTRAAGDHARIIEALRARDLERACAALADNLCAGKAPIVAWLKARDAASVKGKRA